MKVLLTLSLLLNVVTIAMVLSVHQRVSLINSNQFKLYFMEQENGTATVSLHQLYWAKQILGDGEA